MLPLALLPPPRGLRPPNSWATLFNPPSTLTLKQFLLCRLLLLIRVLIYSSSCLVFRYLLSLHHLPTSMTTLPPLLLLQCPDGSRCKKLTSTLASTAFAWRCQPLAEHSCRVSFHIDPDSSRHCCCCYHYRCLRVIIIFVVTIVVIAATSTIVHSCCQLSHHTATSH
jgi:hypothetical protein